MNKEINKTILIIIQSSTPLKPSQKTNKNTIRSNSLPITERRSISNIASNPKMETIMSINKDFRIPNFHPFIIIHIAQGKKKLNNHRLKRMHTNPSFRSSTNNMIGKLRRSEPMISSVSYHVIIFRCFGYPC